MTRSNELINEADRLIEFGNELVNYGAGNPGQMDDEKIKEFTTWITRTGEFIHRLYPKESQYSFTFREFRTKVSMSRLHSNNYRSLFPVIGVIEGIKYELQNGLLSDIQKLLQADIFSDFLEMGEHLLDEGYKDAAAVIIGSVLEDSLRKLADSNGISTINDKGKSLTMDPLNGELTKAGVYDKLVQKQITSWADLRNNAAHGHYDKYDDKQVEMMLHFVQTFCVDYLK